GANDRKPSAVAIREPGPRVDVVPGRDPVGAAGPGPASPDLDVDVSPGGAARLPDTGEARLVHGDPLALVHGDGAALEVVVGRVQAIAVGHPDLVATAVAPPAG